MRRLQLRAEDLRATKGFALLCAAVAAHALSWILPVLDAYRGWQAFRIALTPIVGYRDFSSGTIWYERTLSVASGLTNVLFLATLAICLTRHAAWLRAGRWALIAALVLNLYWFVMMGEDRAELRSGYYLWLASFPLLAGAIHLKSHAGANTSE